MQENHPPRRDNHSLFVTIEGGEGSGKSTLQSDLSKLLTAANFSHICTREPGGSPTAELLRQIFNHPPTEERLTAQGELLLVSAARAQHCAHLIVPSLARATSVICDRFSDSSIVYQGCLGGIADDVLHRIIAFSTGNLLPDLTLLLDVDFATARKRVESRAGVTTRFDDSDQKTFETIRQAYLRLAAAEPDRFCVLDGSNSRAALAEQAKKQLFKVFAAREYQKN